MSEYVTVNLHVTITQEEVYSVHGVHCRARSVAHVILNSEYLGQFVLARVEAQKVDVAARKSHNERTKNTLKHSTC